MHDEKQWICFQKWEERIWITSEYHHCRSTCAWWETMDLFPEIRRKNLNYLRISSLSINMCMMRNNGFVSRNEKRESELPQNIITVDQHVHDEKQWICFQKWEERIWITSEYHHCRSTCAWWETMDLFPEMRRENLNYLRISSLSINMCM